MAPNFVFNGRSCRKNLTKTYVAYYKCFNCDRGCTTILIARINEISEKGEHNCEANRLVIQIPAKNLSPESFVDTFIFEKVPQLNLYPNQIFQLLENSGVQSPCLLPNNLPFFRRYWVGDIHGVQHKMMIWATNQSLLRYNGPTFVDIILELPKSILPMFNIM
ncbi:hypothetical protein HZS_5273, partial [Henneguya salminicola]